MGRGRVMGRGSAESRLRGMGRGSVGAWLRGMGSTLNLIHFFSFSDSEKVRNLLDCISLAYLQKYRALHAFNPSSYYAHMEDKQQLQNLNSLSSLLGHSY